MAARSYSVEEVARILFVILLDGNRNVAVTEGDFCVNSSAVDASDSDYSEEDYGLPSISTGRGRGCDKRGHT